MAKATTWLVLVHHLPPRPTRLRVRVWRQLQKLGAVPVKNSVYVLPSSDRTHEDFAWLQQEIESGGGEAVVFRAEAVTGSTDQELIAAFRHDRDAAYARLVDDLNRTAARWSRHLESDLLAASELDAFEAEVETMQAERDRIREADFFAAAGGAQADAALEKCRTLLQSMQGRHSEPSSRGSRTVRQNDASKYQGKLWVTRPRPHIDRCASAWLIRRFIDRRPRFGFVTPEKKRSGIAYDMPGAEFSHEGEDCTFETLMKRFGLDRDRAVRAIAEIVHDVDLKDGKYGRAEASGVDAVIRGLADRIQDDPRLLRESCSVFDGLHATFAPEARERIPSPRRMRASSPRRRKGGVKE